MSEHKKSTFPNECADKENINTDILTQKHIVCIDRKVYKEQPQGNEVGAIVNRFKQRSKFQQQLTLEEILQAASQGRCFLPYHYEIDHNNKIRFISSKLAFVDVDDKQTLFSVQDVLKQLRKRVSGLFYTFSHGIEGNRYRLAFELDRTVTDENEYKAILKQLAIELQKTGIPADENPNVQPIRGGLKGYEIVENAQPINVVEVLKLVKEREAVEKKTAQQKLIALDGHKQVSFDTLQEMAQHIGVIERSIGRGSEWLNCALGLKLYANSGLITQEQGLNILHMISGDHADARNQWNNGLKPNGKVTIGSFIKLAQDNGFKFKPGTVKAAPQNFVKKTIKIDKYISPEIMKKIILEGGRTLLNSPTGSAKTDATTETFKMIECEQMGVINIIAMPTITLARQVEKKKKFKCIQGKKYNWYNEIHACINEGNRNFVTTYDMAPMLVEHIEKEYQDFKFNLIIDEYHKTVTDYSERYRKKVIKRMIALGQKEQCHSFIGLSGTIDDIDCNDFDKVVNIESNYPSSPCQEFQVYTYKKKKDGLVQLIELIRKRAADGYRLLVFIEQKEKIATVKKALVKQGIVTRVVTADDKSNTYQNIVERESVEAGVQVVLATTVIADGVNILNDVNEKWEVITACTDFSQIFNPSIIKQISNRLRNEYERFSIFIQESNREKSGMYDMDEPFYSRLEMAGEFRDEINDHAHFDKDFFITSTIERLYGLYINDEGAVDVDAYALRHEISKKKATYYHAFRNDFIEAVENILHMKQLDKVQLEADAVDLYAEIERLNELTKQSNKEKAAMIDELFTPEVYRAIRLNNPEVKAAFKKAAHENHYAAAVSAAKLTDYETCKKITKDVTRRADIHAFKKEIRHLCELQVMLDRNSLAKPSKTRDALRSIVQLNKAGHTYNDIVKSAAIRVKCTEKEIEQVINDFFIVETKRVRQEGIKTRVKEIVGRKTIETVADAFGISVDEVQHALDQYRALHKLPDVKKLAEKKVIQNTHVFAISEPIREDLFTPEEWAIFDDIGRQIRESFSR